MATTFTWSIANLEYTIGEGGVVVAHWRCTGVDGDYSASSYGTQTWAPDPELAGYTPLADLTEEVVLGWITGKADVEAGITAKIDELKNPATESGLPWSE